MITENTKQSFEECFEKFVKNRNVLCNEKGQLKKENVRYKKNLQALADKVGEAAKQVAMEAIHFVSSADEKSLQEVKVLWAGFTPIMRSVLMTGSKEEFYSLVEDFKNQSLDICVKNDLENNS